MVLYDNVKKLCEEKGVSILSLEKALGFPRSSICKWNDNEPGIRKVQKVAEYLGVSIEKLLKEDDEKGSERTNMVKLPSYIIEFQIAMDGVKRYTGWTDEEFAEKLGVSVVTLRGARRDPCSVNGG